ncbi:serine/threonine-protein kinase [Phycisphaerales bacterium AB-hyl4]|uniref:Serine/threonine-protein kinase n=1 Tax=Natronomicrosphaera hydrolytica TaxID=3242702 RepID=A0ABV4U0B1_9BACT
MAEQVTQSSLDSLIGRMVVEKGLATPEEVQRCVELQRSRAGSADDSASGHSLAEVLIGEGVATQKQIERIRPEAEEQRRGQQIPGYVILERLGAGAMATVYKARQISLDRAVAIKVLPRKHTNNPQFVDRFYAEGKAAAKLNHPNIVQAIDVGKAGEYHYFVMEYVEGRTVFDDITRRGRYDEKDALSLAIQVSRALHHAHEAGFIHRDVKPKNIMITEEGRAKLADMGLARAVSDREAAEAEAGKAFGTPYYISPEQIRGARNVDFRADIYSLGATLYHMVTGQVPFEGPSPSAVMHKHLKEELTPPDHLNTELSTGIAEIIEVCMAKDPEQRYANTADLLQDLEAVQSGEPPMQARHMFDLGSITALSKPDDGPSGQTQVLQFGSGEPLTGQPMFWIATCGWVVAAFLLLALILLAM